MAKDENKESEIRGDEQEIVDQRLPVWRPQDADREYYRYETKKRIQHYTVPPQTIFRPAKPTPTIRDAEHKRVAVYARVSTKSRAGLLHRKPNKVLYREDCQNAQLGSGGNIQ